MVAVYSFRQITFLPPIYFLFLVHRTREELSMASIATFKLAEVSFACAEHRTNNFGRFIWPGRHL